MVVLVVYVAILCPIHVFVLALVKELLPRKTISYNGRCCFLLLCVSLNDIFPIEINATN